MTRGPGECSSAATASTADASTPVSLIRRLLTLASTRLQQDGSSWDWLEVERTAMRLLAELGGVDPPPSEPRE